MKKQLRYFFEQSSGFQLRLLWGLTLGLLNIVCGLLFIYISKGLVDIATGKAEGSLWQHVGYLAFMLVLRLAISGLRQWVMGRTQQRLVNSMRSRLFRMVLNSPWHGREDLKSGDVMSRISEDLRVVVDCITNHLPAIVLCCFQLFAASWFLFTLQPKLLLVLFLILPFALVLSKLYYKTMRRLTKQIRTEESDIMSHIQESVQNRALLLSLQRTGLMSERLMSRHSQLFGTYSHRLRFSIRTRLLIQSGFSIGYYTTFVWAVYGLMTGSVTYGMMTALLQLVAQVQSPILDLSSLFPSIVQAGTAAERLEEIQYQPKEKTQTPTQAVALSGQMPFGLGLSHVCYRYPDGGEDILKDFSCAFPAGSSTAIIGPTGSGKTTLVRLLLGLLTPDSGSVDLLDAEGRACGKPAVQMEGVSSNEAQDYPSPIAYVPQGNSLLSGSIRDNLLLGRLDATEEEMHDALRRASALFVFDLPQGLDAPCGEKGSGLSEGQAQRIAIARALLQPGSILILDEASSALDPDTERQILEELQQQDLGKTLIWVTHHMVVRDYMQNCILVD